MHILPTPIVDNDLNNSIVSVDYSQSGNLDLQRFHYTGRVYALPVTFERKGETATLIFFGYNTPEPLPSAKAGALLGFPVANYRPLAAQVADYRAIMVATLKRGSAPKIAHEDSEDESDED